MRKNIKTTYADNVADLIRKIAEGKKPFIFIWAFDEGKTYKISAHLDLIERKHAEAAKKTLSRYYGKAIEILFDHEMGESKDKHDRPFFGTLKARGQINKYKRWTKGEINTLRHLFYKGWPDIAIANKLQRERRSVANKRFNLRLVKHRWSHGRV